MILDHSISIGTESLTTEEACVVHLIISQLLFTSMNDILETVEGNVQLIYDARQHLPSLHRTFSFSFDELRHSPWICTAWLREKLSKMLPLMHSTATKNVVDKIVGHAAHLAYLRHRQGNVNSGYVFEATLEIVHLQMSGIETGRYVEGGDKEEVIACSVCLENLTVGMEYTKLPCSHIFHTSCVDPWMETNKTCPNCRHELVYKNVTEEMLAEFMILINATSTRIPST